MVGLKGGRILERLTCVNIPGCTGEEQVEETLVVTMSVVAWRHPQLKLTGGDDERSPGGDACEVRLKRDGDRRSGGRRSRTVWLSFRAGVLPYSRASLSYVRELAYSVCLWPPYVIGGPLYFCPVVSIFYLLSFFSSPNLSGRILDVYHTLTHGVALVRI